MNRRLIVLVSAVAALLAAGATVAIASSAGPDDEPGPRGSAVHQTTESTHNVETYWTLERMRTAKGD